MSNVPRIKLSLLSESDDTFPSLQALSNLHYLCGGLMDYLWSCELDISNFGPVDRQPPPAEFRPPSPSPPENFSGEFSDQVLNVTPSNRSMQQNVEYLRALLYGSIAQDMRTTSKRVF
ncbi:hypothetical protein Tco_1369910 [Tanacetum coccineum]